MLIVQDLSIERLDKKIFENIQKVALSVRLPVRLAAYTFWSLLLLLLMLLGAVALAVAFAVAVAVAVADTFRMGGGPRKL